MSYSKAFSLLLLSTFAFTEVGAAEFDISVRRHEALTKPNDSEIKKILEISNAIVAESTSVDDIACQVMFALDGSVGTFEEDEIPYHIDSKAAFNKVKRAPGTVKIVGDISWCGRLGTNIAGCASTPGTGLVVRFGPNRKINALIFTHEFAHTTGSRHREKELAVMRSVVNKSNEAFNDKECVRLASGPNAALFGDPLAANTGTSPAHSETLDDRPESVLDFVSNQYAHGVPFGTASSYTDENVQELVQALKSEPDAHVADNIVSTLGAIGSDSARDALIAYLIEDNSLELSGEELVTRASVLSSLGWLVNRSGDITALQLLLNASNADWWAEEVDIDWDNPVYKDQEALISYLVSKAIVGLTLSGSAEARARLEQMQASVDPGLPQPIIADNEALAFTSKFGDTSLISNVSPGTLMAVTSAGGSEFVEQYLREMTAIQSNGLVDYYD